jgi:hypothetical protein
MIHSYLLSRTYFNLGESEIVSPPATTDFNFLRKTARSGRAGARFQLDPFFFQVESKRKSYDSTALAQAREK